MYPKLHRDVLDQLRQDDLDFEFKKRPNSRDLEQEYDTYIQGRFYCPNKACGKNGWSSKKVAVTIRMFTNNRYNVTVYHQRCKSCNFVSRPSLDDSYADRVSYRLKKWSGIDVVPPVHSRESERPHETSLCEGCRAGHCSQRIY